MKFDINTTVQSRLAKTIVNNIVELKKGREKTLIKNGEVKVNGVKVKTDITVKVGDLISVFVPDMFLNKFDLPIVFEDQNIVIVDKPINVESEDQLPKLLFERCGKLLPAHRLDTNTTGLIMLAKSNVAYKELASALKHKLIKKTYNAKLFGAPDELVGQVRNYLCKDTVKGIVKVCDGRVRSAMEAVTHYEITQVRDGISYAILSPETGRTHQLRVHMAHINCPIVGDSKYGDFKLNKELNIETQQLRAVKLKFGKLPGVLGYLSGREFKVRSIDEQ